MNWQAFDSLIGFVAIIFVFFLIYKLLDKDGRVFEIVKNFIKGVGK